MARHDPPGPKLGIVVVTYGSPQLLVANLAAMTLPESSIQVIIVDNLKSQEDTEQIRGICGPRGWRLLENKTNLGFGRALNIGVQESILSGCDTHLVLNPDAHINVEAVSQLRLDCYNDQYLVVAPQIIRPTGAIWSSGGHLDKRTGLTYSHPASNGQPARSLWLSGACFMTSSAMWTKMGGIDEDYFLYWEDVDLGERCIRSGGHMRVRTDLSAVHDVGGTQATQGKSHRYYYFNCKNRLSFAAKNLQRRDIGRWILMTPVATWILLARGGRRALAQHPGHLVAAIAGSAHGILIATTAAIGLTPHHSDARPVPAGSGARVGFKPKVPFSRVSKPVLSRRDLDNYEKEGL